MSKKAKLDPKLDSVTTLYVWKVKTRYLTYMDNASSYLFSSEKAAKADVERSFQDDVSKKKKLEYRPSYFADNGGEFFLGDFLVATVSKVAVNS